MILTFALSFLQDFKSENNINDRDFPLIDYEQYLKQFLEDLAVHTYKTMPYTYAGKYTPEKFQMTAVESIFYALNRFGWLIRLQKSTFMKDKFVFLGASWDMSEETI